MGTECCLTIGWIPENSKEERISCGDASGSGTIESLVWVRTDQETLNDEVHCEISGRTYYPKSHSDWWGNRSKLWTAIAKDLAKLSGQKGVAISGAQLVGCWRIFNQESYGEEGLGLKVVAEGEDCGGEFANKDGRHNGKFYVRYTMQIDDEYDDEMETIIIIDRSGAARLQ